MSRRRHYVVPAAVRGLDQRPGRRLLVELEGTHTIVEAASARDAARVSHRSHSPAPAPTELTTEEQRDCNEALAAYVRMSELAQKQVGGNDGAYEEDDGIVEEYEPSEADDGDAWKHDAE